ncbi:MAG: biopolymer transporter ExbD [Thermodesulfobacteriaceae bacterium]|nr:biopolymer transporter ExbD [Thermodesulfobacteriaceae bacterium]
MKVGRELQDEINVIPLVDIVLVILIIFMITAPLMTTGLEVELPKTKESSFTQKEKEPLRITITEKGEIKISGERIDLEALGRWLEEAKKHELVREVQLEADRRVVYDIVAKVLAEIQRAGFNQIGLVTLPEK